MCPIYKNPIFPYYFVSLFSDGSVYYQTEDDVSLLNSTKSSFYDVLEKEKESSIIAFALYDIQTQTEYLTDLRDGHFEINQIPFKLHEDYVYPDYRLIYFRKNDVLFNGTNITGKTTSFNFGWQTTFRGENIKKIITLK